MKEFLFLNKLKRFSGVYLWGHLENLEAFVYDVIEQNCAMGVAKAGQSEK